MILSSAKFVQIAVASSPDGIGDVYALDENGNVWNYDWGGANKKPEWRNLSTKRAELPREFQP